MPNNTRNKERAILDLGSHVKKALAPCESAPKQKHVRQLIVFAHDFGTSGPIWSCFRLQPILTDEVQCFKAMVVVHKLLVGGPKTVLREAWREKGLFERAISGLGRSNLGLGYGPLIKAYGQYLLAKLQFHQEHGQFTGSFDYEEYLTLAGVGNIDEGYQTVVDLFDLAARLHAFQRTILKAALGPAVNECRVSALVPLVEESWGIYCFLTSMLTALHLTVPDKSALVPLVEQYERFFLRLSEFYEECRRIPYLVSLVMIPSLPSPMPSFDERREADMMKDMRVASLEIEQADSASIDQLDTVSLDLQHTLYTSGVNREVVEEANEQLMRLGMQLQETIDDGIKKDALIADLQAVHDNIVINACRN